MIHSQYIDYVQTSLNNLGFSDVWLQQSVNFVKIFVELLKKRIKNQFSQSWSTNAFNSNTCTNYRIFKNSWSSENYWKMLPKNLALQLCRFRCRNHKLPVKKDILYGVEANQRLSHLCSNNKVVDVFHYIFECNHFKADRNKLIPNSYRATNTWNFNKLFNISDYNM